MQKYMDDENLIPKEQIGCCRGSKVSNKDNRRIKSPHVKSVGTQHTKARLREVLKEKWKNKVMHGRYIRIIDRQLISEEDTFLWLSKGDLKAENESEIVAAQD